MPKGNKPYQTVRQSMQVIMYSNVASWGLPLFVRHFRTYLAFAGGDALWGDFVAHAIGDCDYCRIVLGEMTRRGWGWFDFDRVSRVIDDLINGME